MLEQLKRPFKRHYDKYRAKADGFVGPIKDSASKLFALVPGFKSFAGSENLADGTLTEDEAAANAKPGLRARLKNFKQSLKGYFSNSSKICFPCRLRNKINASQIFINMRNLKNKITYAKSSPHCYCGELFAYVQTVDKTGFPRKMRKTRLIFVTMKLYKIRNKI